ncbi:MAG: DUF1275 domain-containing protein [Bacteroidia bacterium]|nr:DUF1275 domain-containing protein [Bacteroidia bacterium]
MFRHHGESRTPLHNFKIASLLSFVAGMVNVAGFLAVQRLTTNVTGHFAFFVDEVFKLNFKQSITYFLFIFFFFLGSFVSGFLIELINKINHRYVYIIPTLIECCILVVVAFFGTFFINYYPEELAYLLLFAMGLQNSLVTSISSARVRTTHLTGLFTDLGIELSQLLFYKQTEQKSKLIASVKLRIVIITSFFIGGVICGIFYSTLQLKILFIATLVLLAGLIYDYFRVGVLLIKRKYTH